MIGPTENSTQSHIYIQPATLGVARQDKLQTGQNPPHSIGPQSWGVRLSKVLSSQGDSLTIHEGPENGSEVTLRCQGSWSI